MSERMWSLDAFRFDEGIEAAQVTVFDEAFDEGNELLARDEAIALAHERGANLVAWWPFDAGTIPSCIVAKVSLPLRWERLPDEEPPLDERLWFEGDCGKRDFIAGNGHTFVGRMAAWCPHDQVGYNVSLGEIETMSDESRYFIAGFLVGNEPGYPTDDEGDDGSAADMVAWESARRRFRRTGLWFGRWGTCGVCGCVLLPDTAGDRCHEHSAETG